MCAGLVAAVAVTIPLSGAASAVDPAAPPPPTVLRSRLSLRAEHGYFDDAWALEATGRRLAVIQTDRDSFQRLGIWDLDAPEGGSAGRVPEVIPVARVNFDLPPPARALESVTFLPAGSGLVLLSTAAGPDTRLLQALDEGGKVVGRAGPVWAFGFPADLAATRPAKLVTVERRAIRDGELAYGVTPLRLPGLKAAGKGHTYAVAADGTLRGGQALAPVGFFDGYGKLLAQRPGWYDKKKDARQPDAQAVLDLLSDKTAAEAPIDDVYGWARTSRLRREHPNRTAFIQLADTIATAAGMGSGHQGDNGIELVDPSGGLAPIPLAVPFRLYDRFTLRDQEGPDAQAIHFAIQIDPVNPDAVRRKKADPPALDVYSVPIAHPEAAHLRGRVALDAQPVTWAVAGSHLVVFRRFKSYARGGDRIDVYDLVP